MSLIQVGIGTVAEDKPSGEYYADIFMLEAGMFSNRDINVKEKETLSIKLPSGQVKQLSVDENFKVKAKWLKMGDSNRITPPELVAKSYVMIYQKPGYDEYYWVKIFEELDLGKRETVTYAWSNRPEGETDNSSYLENAYRLSVSTHEGEIRFVTTKANEEQASYTLLMDTKNGLLGVEDDSDNSFILDSVKGKVNLNILKDHTAKIGENQNTLILKNSNTQIDGQSNIQLTGPLTMVAKSSINHSLKGDYNLESREGCNLKIVSDIQAKTMGSLKIQTNQDTHLVTNGGKVQVISGSEVTIVAPIINLLGVVNTGVLNCSAMNMGSPPPPPPPVVVPEIEKIDTKPVEDAVELIKQETEKKDSESGNSSNSSTGSTRSSDDPWENETKPPKPEPEKEPSQSVSTMSKEAIMNADLGMTINSNNKIVLDSKGSLQLKGTTGIEIKGVTGDLTDLLEQILDAIAIVGDMPIITPSGNSVPDQRWNLAISNLKALIKSWKGV